MDKSIMNISFKFWGVIVCSYLFNAPTQAVQFSSDNCASFDQADIQPAQAAHEAASEYLLQQGMFVRVVDGYAKLNTGLVVGNLSGGGTNTNGTILILIVCF
jgi:hypothetical protein